MATETTPTNAIDRAIGTWQPPAVVFPLSPELRRHLSRHVGRVLAGDPNEAVIDEQVPVDPERVTFPGDSGERESWEVLPTKAHLSTDDIDAPGTGPDGWGIYLEGMAEDGYFAWFSREHEARNLVADHNAAVEAACEVERLQGELETFETGAQRLRAEVQRLGLRLTHVGIESVAGAWSKHELPGLYALVEEG